MKLDLVFLCDKLEFSKDGLFNVKGGGISCLHFKRLPQKRRLAILIDVKYSPAKESGNHIFELRVIDDKGINKLSHEVTQKAYFQSGKGFHDFGGDIYPVFDKFGLHKVEVWIDRRKIASLPLTIMKETP